MVLLPLLRHTGLDGRRPKRPRDDDRLGRSHIRTRGRVIFARVVRTRPLCGIAHDLGLWNESMGLTRRRDAWAAYRRWTCDLVTVDDATGLRVCA